MTDDVEAITGLEFLADIRQQIENRGHKVGTKLNSSNLD
jgi:hypothetical protein